MTFAESYLSEAAIVLGGIDRGQVEALAMALAEVRARHGRVFLLGLGGSAAHASHAAADFHKLCGLDAICLTDNVSAYTAAANDHDPDRVFCTLIDQHDPEPEDAVLAISVGGGTRQPEVSQSLMEATNYMQRAHEAKVFGIVGRDGGFVAQVADVCVIIPPRYPDHVTPHTESLMSVVLHCLVSHPALQVQQPLWERLA